jgi:ATP/maltotriose-dependent transcriptional regulator MalT
MKHVGLHHKPTDATSMGLGRMLAHIQNIGRKLAVTRRGEAVRRARQLKLI